MAKSIKVADLSTPELEEQATRETLIGKIKEADTDNFLRSLAPDLITEVTSMPMSEQEEIETLRVIRQVYLRMWQALTARGDFNRVTLLAKLIEQNDRICRAKVIDNRLGARRNFQIFYRETTELEIDRVMKRMLLEA